MTYLIHCSDRRICGGISILRRKLEGVCRFCLVAPKREKKETQYQVALKDELDYLKRTGASESGTSNYLSRFNKRWKV